MISNEIDRRAATLKSRKDDMIQGGGHEIPNLPVNTIADEK
jgi:hypothetical protein